MIDIPKTDKLFLILHRACRSIGDTTFVGNDGISRLVCGTKDDHSIQVHGNSKEEAWKRAEPSELWLHERYYTARRNDRTDRQSPALDQALREELAGYDEYAQRVRYRLVPGVE
jgi:hypothetical protein